MQGLAGLHLHVCSVDKILDWPPDVFGFAAHFAKVTGIYTAFARKPLLVAGLGASATKDGKRWRRGLGGVRKAIPKPIRDAWKIVCSNRGATVDELVRNDEFVKAILYLLACADEACVGVGIAEQGTGIFELTAEVLLSINGNLCRAIPPDVVRVLPKLHTPNSGLNIRSLSHHLSICSANEVSAQWTVTPISVKERSSCLKFLLAPWPLTVGPAAYTEASHSANNGRNYGYFDYVPPVSSTPVDAWLRCRLDQAAEIGHKLDLVVFPECALDEKEWRSVAKLCAERGIGLVAGVHKKGRGTKRSRNMVKMRLPLVFEDITQDKHHRWQIDASQIRAYSFGEALSANKIWWENIEIGERKLQFVSMSPEVTMCSLVCEDLARQDPVAEMVRAVGPNLVIALLSDGPQVNGRWPSRYASVLADDPGSSVLTISSLGMVERSRPSGHAVNRTVASWKDVTGGYVPLDLGAHEDAILIDIQIIKKEEWSVDGRSDGQVATFPVLSGIHGLGAR